MCTHKQLLFAVSKRTIQATSSRSSNVLRNSSRYFSSVIPNISHHDDHDDDGYSRESYSKKQALQNLLQSNSIATKKLPLLPFPKTEVTPTSVVIQKPHENLFISPSQLIYTGHASMPVTSDLHIVTPQEDTPTGTWPIYRIMDEDGSFRDGKADAYKFERKFYLADNKDSLRAGLNPSLDSLRDKLKHESPYNEYCINNSALLAPSIHPYPDIETNDSLLRAYTQMVRLREMDKILQNAQRQGRISFYITCHGEEAIHIGAASALELKDTVLAQYREAGVLMWRGFTLNQFTDQCFSNEKDLGKGRQMPVHYGSRALNYQTISSPLGTQIPQAVGAAYRLKQSGKEAVAACFFGDGCASTTDFHSGLNFAATLHAPVIFFCRNNGYAISTPVNEQYAGDGIVSRAPGYGVAGIRVDGNDVFAVHEAVREAREYALKHSAPVLIEAMTYRQGHHSTSDDSLRYRSAKEVQHFAQHSDPIKRLQNFLERQGYLTGKDFTDIENKEKHAVIAAMREAERRPKPPLHDLFTDVYHEMPKSLQEQQRQLEEHLKKYAKSYK